MDAIVVDELRKSYGAVLALDGVSFAVREGEVFALLGPNGAGKSTTVRVLVTLTKPDGGTASVGGHDVAREPNAVRQTIGYVPQESGVDRFGTGRENLALQGRVQGMGGRDLKARIDELLELVGIADAADRVVRGLTTHYLEEADELADRLVIVSRGQVVARGTPAELKGTLRGDAVQVEVAAGEIDQAQAVLAAEGARPETVLEGRTIVARVEDGGRALPGLLAALDAAGIAVERVSVSRPSLDDVYLHYTGRDFTSEDRQG